jgi:hypothetical protein
VDDEVVAVPGERHRVRLDRVVIVAGRAVDEVDGVRRVGQRGLSVADENLDRLADAVRRARVCPGLRESARRRGLVGDRDQRGGVVSLLLGFGQDHGDRLAVPVDAVVLHDRQVAAPGRPGRGQEQRRRLHPRGVAMGHDERHAGRGLGGARVERRDPTARYRAVAQRRVNHVIHHVLSGEARLAADLDRPVQT